MASNIEAMVFAVSSFPLAGMLDEYRACFSKPQFRHFQNVLAGLMLNGKGEKNVMDLADNALDGRRQIILEPFPAQQEMVRGGGGPPPPRQHARGHKGGVLGHRRTLHREAGHEMEGTGYLLRSRPASNIWCHCFVTSMYSNGDERVPMHLEPYIKEEACASSGRRFRTKNELAVELVDKALEYRPRPSSSTLGTVHRN